MRLASILVGIAICVPLFALVGFAFYWSSDVYRFDVRQISSIPSKSLKIWHSVRFAGPWVGLIAGIVVGDAIADIIRRLTRASDEKKALQSNRANSDV